MEYLEEKEGGRVNKSGDQMTGNLNMLGSTITRMDDLVRQVVYRRYVDTYAVNKNCVNCWVTCLELG